VPQIKYGVRNELKAELLLGKALNLELARELALRGDSAAAAKEMMNQVGSLADFQELNVIQQKSLAAAIGMSADELANSLKTQDLLLKTGDKSVEALNERRRLAIETGKTEEFYAELRRAGTSDELIAQQMQLGNQDKMNLLIEKSLETFSNMVEPLTNIVGAFADLVSHSTIFKSAIASIAGIMTFKMLSSITSTVAQTMLLNRQLTSQIAIQKMLARTAEEKAAAEAIALGFSTGGLGMATAVLSIGAALAAFGLSGGFSGGGFSGGGENINTNQVNKNNNNNQSTSTPSDKPIVVHIDNRFDVGNRGIATIATRTAQNTGPQDKTN
jgi:hypothetical protein